MVAGASGAVLVEKSESQITGGLPRVTLVYRISSKESLIDADGRLEGAVQRAGIERDVGDVQF